MAEIVRRVWQIIIVGSDGGRREAETIAVAGTEADSASGVGRSESLPIMENIWRALAKFHLPRQNVRSWQYTRFHLSGTIAIGAGGRTSN